MRTLFIIPLVLMSLVSFPSWGLTIDDLVQREGVYYKKFTDVPFTGEIDEGTERGSLINGKKDGDWENFHGNGQLLSNVRFNSGFAVGNVETFDEKGNLRSKGDWDRLGRQGMWIWFHNTGQLQSKGNYKNNEREGYWITYNEDGTVWEDLTGTYENDVKVSD